MHIHTYTFIMIQCISTHTYTSMDKYGHHHHHYHHHHHHHCTATTTAAATAISRIITSLFRLKDLVSLLSKLLYEQTRKSWLNLARQKERVCSGAAHAVVHRYLVHLHCYLSLLQPWIHRLTKSECVSLCMDSCWAWGRSSPPSNLTPTSPHPFLL